MRSLLSTLMISGMLAMGSGAQPGHAASGDDRVKASLIADTSGIMPGQAFRVGVVLDVKPGWHVYWKNAGETGLPTEVTIRAPKGFEVGAVQYPVPTRFVQPGDIEGFGYEEQVMFIVSVMSPPDLSTSQPVTIQADASFLACERVCIPGKASAELSLPVLSKGQPAHPANAEAFTTWKARVPVTAGAAQELAAVNVTTEAPGRFSVAADWKQPARDVEFFPAAEAALNLTDPKAANEENRSVLQFRAEVFQGLSLESTTMPLVIAFTDPQGQRRGIEVAVPLDSIATKK